MPEQHIVDSGFWYDTSPNGQRRRAVALLQAMRAYRAAEVSMRRRTREALSLGENDMVLLRYLLEAKGQQRSVSPGELARQLAVSTASMTAMIDRLERSGHVHRERHATDRRSIYVVPTERTEHDMRWTLGDMHQRMLDAVLSMSPDESRVVIEMLDRLIAVVDDIDPRTGAHRHEPSPATFPRRVEA